MKNYLVRIRAQVPYPKDFDYRIEAGSMGRAMDFAYRNFRKEYAIKGTREKEIACVVFPLKAMSVRTETLEENDVENIVEKELEMSKV